MNARNFFAPTRDTLKRNQFGGTIGGPVKKNKLFFFFGYQDTMTRQDPVSNSAATFVPTAAMITGDFSGCPADLSAAVLAGIPAATASQIHQQSNPRFAARSGVAQAGGAAAAADHQRPLRQHVLRPDYRRERRSVCRPRRLPDQRKEHPVRALYPRLTTSGRRRQNFTPNNLLTSTRRADWMMRTSPGPSATRICSARRW